MKHFLFSCKKVCEMGCVQAFLTCLYPFLVINQLFMCVILMFFADWVLCRFSCPFIPRNIADLCIEGLNTT